MAKVERHGGYTFTNLHHDPKCTECKGTGICTECGLLPEGTDCGLCGRTEPTGYCCMCYPNPCDECGGGQIEGVCAKCGLQAEHRRVAVHSSKCSVCEVLCHAQKDLLWLATHNQVTSKVARLSIERALAESYKAHKAHCKGPEVP